MRNAHCALTMTCALATAGVGMSAATAVAQEAVLPPVVVEGATLAIPSKKPSNKENAPSEFDADDSAGGTSAAGEPVSDATQSSEAPGNSTEGIQSGKVGSAVSVVTGAELKDRQIRHAADALRSLPGVSVSSQGGPQSLTVVRNPRS